jgi:hypothetical protein
MFRTLKIMEFDKINMMKRPGRVTVIFDAEVTNSLEMQKNG